MQDTCHFYVIDKKGGTGLGVGLFHQLAVDLSHRCQPIAFLGSRYGHLLFDRFQIVYKYEVRSSGASYADRPVTEAGSTYLDFCTFRQLGYQA